MQQEIPEEIQQQIEAKRKAKEENEFILEKQKIQLGCDEMQRITDDIIVPSFLKAAKAIKKIEHQIEVVLMDCESPIDQKLYNVGARCSIGESSKFMLIADPSAFDFTFTRINADESEDETILHFHEVIPQTIEGIIQSFLKVNLPEVAFTASSAPGENQTFTPPFRVQYDDKGSISDVASTDTVAEAIKMGATFAQMFKKEDAITIIDAKDNILC